LLLVDGYSGARFTALEGEMCHLQQSTYKPGRRKVATDQKGKERALTKIDMSYSLEIMET
jgi:hypothetical protein